MDNPNDYDDAKYTDAFNRLYSAVCSMWNSGATLDQISEVISSALDDSDLDVAVEITEV